MATGTITLNFDSPDVDFIADGTFDVSYLFQDLFVNNPEMKKQVGLKIKEIFNSIDSKKIAKEWQENIAKVMGFEDAENFKIEDFGKNMQDKLSGILDNLRVGSSPAVAANTAAIPAQQDPTKEVSVYDSVQNVKLVDFDDKALEKLQKIFGSISVGGISSTGNATVDKNSTNGMFSNLLKSLGLSTLPSVLRGLTGGALLAGGLIWMAMDGISGYFKADEWGVSGISAALGGALGGIGSGADNAYKNAIKGGLVGGGIGTLVGGPLGLIVGSLLGAAVGYVLGYIGGERIAKAFEDMGVWWKANVSPKLAEWKNDIRDWWENPGGMKDTWGEFATRMGPIMSDFGKWSNEHIIPALEALAVALGDALVWLGENGDWILAGTIDTLETIWEILEDVGHELKSFATRFGKWFSSTNEQFMNESLSMQFMHGAGLISLGEDDPTQKMRKTFFQKFIFFPMRNWLNATGDKLMESGIKTIAKSADTSVKEAGELLAEKGGLKLLTAIGGKSAIWGAVKLGLGKILKYIPGVSLVLGLVEAIDDFKKGNFFSGLLSLASGIAAVFPGLGTAISIVLDAAKIGLQTTEVGQLTESGFSSFYRESFLPFLRKMPVIGQFIAITEAIGAFSTGDWKGGLDLLFEMGIISFGGGILEMFGGPSVTEQSTMIQNAMTKVWEPILSFFEYLGVVISDAVGAVKGKVQKVKHGFMQYFDASAVSLDAQIAMDKAAAAKAARTPIKTQDMYIVDGTVRAYQPDNKDKFEMVGSKEGGVLETQLSTMAKLLTKVVEELDKANSLNKTTAKETVKVLTTISKLNQAQVDILPALKYTPPKDTGGSSQIPNTESRDPIYENKNYMKMVRRF